MFQAKILTLQLTRLFSPRFVVQLVVNILPIVITQPNIPKILLTVLIDRMIYKIEWLL